MTQDQKLMEKSSDSSKSLSLKTFKNSMEIIWICLIKLKSRKTNDTFELLLSCTFAFIVQHVPLF